MSDGDAVARYAADLEWIAEVVDHADVRGFLEQDRRRMQHIALATILGFVLFFGGILSAMLLSQNQTRSGKAARWLLHGAFSGVEGFSGAAAAVVLYCLSALCRAAGVFFGVLSKVNCASYVLTRCQSVAGQVLELGGSRERLVQKLLSEDDQAKVEEGKPTKKKREKKEPEKKVEKVPPVPGPAKKAKKEKEELKEAKPPAKVEAKTEKAGPVRVEPAPPRKKADVPARKDAPVKAPAPEILADEEPYEPYLEEIPTPPAEYPPTPEELEIPEDELEGMPEDFWCNVLEKEEKEEKLETPEETPEEKPEEKPVKKQKKATSPVMPTRPTKPSASSMALPPVRSAARAPEPRRVEAPAIPVPRPPAARTTPPPRPTIKPVVLAAVQGFHEEKSAAVEGDFPSLTEAKEKKKAPPKKSSAEADVRSQPAPAEPDFYDAPPMRAPPAPPARAPPKVQPKDLVPVPELPAPPMPEEELVATEVKEFEGSFFSFLEEEEDKHVAPKQVMRTRSGGVLGNSFFAGRLEEGEGEDSAWLATIDAKACYDASPGSNSTVVPSDEGDEHRLSDSESGGASSENEPEGPTPGPAQKKAGIQHVQSGDTHTRKRIAQEAALHAATAWGDWPKQEQRGQGQYVHIETHQSSSREQQYQQTQENEFTWSPCPPPGSAAAAEPPRMYSLNVNKRPTSRQWW